MIPRYSHPEMNSLWTDQYKYETYLKVELAILAALEGEKVPTGVTEKIRKLVKINPERVDALEAQVHHDVIAFCSSITEQIPEDLGRFFHFGVTSSDVIDTSLTLQIKASLEIVLPLFEKCLKALLKRAQESKDIVSMGRSHGMFAEPLSFGQKLLGHYAEFGRRYQDLKAFYENELTGQFSGAVGSYTILSPAQEQRALKSLGLKVEPVSTQVIPRDRIAKLVSINALLADAIERLSIEIRHLHRSEVKEVSEGFKPGQKGSSTMPHKKNPISGENMSGLCRYLRSHVLIAHENTLLWHERDISHSSAERLFLPDHFGILAYVLKRLESTLLQLEVHQETIENRVRSQSAYLSSFYLHLLIEHFPKAREALYAIVQKAAFASDTAGDPQVFYAEILKSTQGPEFSGVKLDLPKPDFKKIKEIYLGHVDAVFKRTLAQYPLP